MVLKIANGARSLIVLAKREIGSIEFQKMPIICLIWIDQHDRESVYELTRYLLSIGVINFLTYGNDAEILHDYIDDVLIEAGRVDIATTDHGNSSVGDVVHFLLIVLTLSQVSAVIWSLWIMWIPIGRLKPA